MKPVRFDEVPGILAEIIEEVAEELAEQETVFAVRDLWSRIRFVVPERPAPGTGLEGMLSSLAEQAQHRLGAFAHNAENAVLYGDEMSIDFSELGAEPGFSIGADHLNLTVRLIDRQITNRSWSTVSEGRSESKAHRMAFYSLKGGVGRSTAAALAGWHLARTGRSVLILDLDLEAPGISTSLLPVESRPEFGMVDWFVEDAVGQGDSMVELLSAPSPLAHESPGNLWVVPSHGREPGDFVAKLGRSFLDLPGENGPEPWERRLERVLRKIESHRNPDVVLIDARSGFHDLASTAVTELSDTVLLFAVGSDQTWNGYRLLFDHWHRFGVARSIRERLQIVSALVPETERETYLSSFRESSWSLFRELLYDELGPGEIDGFSFDLNDDPAPHGPLPIYWHRGLAELKTLASLDAQLVDSAAGKFLSGMDSLLEDFQERA